MLTPTHWHGLPLGCCIVEAYSISYFVQTLRSCQLSLYQQTAWRLCQISWLSLPRFLTLLFIPGPFRGQV